MKNNVGKCGHAKCAGGKLCYEKGAPMSKYEPVPKSLLTKPTTKDEARQYAIDWQNWTDKHALYMSELVEWEAVFVELAKKYNLEEEFKENGII